MEDLRLGLPSASSFSLTALCPGRESLLRSLPIQPEIKDEDAQRGVDLHMAWQLDDPSALDAEDVEIYERGMRLVEEVKMQWVKDHIPDSQFCVAIEGPREERFYLRNNEGDIVASGQSDRHWHWVRRVLVIDFKSLWCRNLVPSELNWQARLLSVLVSQEYGASHVRFAFLKASFGRADIVDYGPEDLKHAEFSIQNALWQSNQPDAQRRAGPHCRFCKAAYACQECLSWQLLPSVQVGYSTGNASNPISPKMAVELVENVSLRDCAKIHTTATARHNIEAAITARLKRQDAETLASLGLKLGKPQIMRPITNPYAAFNFLRGLGVPDEKLWSAVKIGNGELAVVVQAALDLGSEKEATEWIRSKLSSCIEAKEKEPTLEKL